MDDFPGWSHRMRKNSVTITALSLAGVTYLASRIIARNRFIIL